MDNVFWLVSTERLKDGLWFRDEEDFKSGMNLVAVEATVMDVGVMAFVLMSNHVHFLLGGGKDSVINFINRFKTRYSQYFSKKYGIGGLLRKNAVDVREVCVGDESFERAVAYIQMNSVAANICLHPTAYPWGTGDAFFRQQAPRGVRVGDMTARACIRLFHSKVALPKDYVVDNRGFIDTSSYVQVKFVESVFRTPNRMDYYLRFSSKARHMHINEGPSFGDQILVAAIHDLSVSLFRRNGLQELGEAQQAEILKQLKRRFSSDPNQLSRVTGMGYDTVCRLLDQP